MSPVMTGAYVGTTPAATIRQGATRVLNARPGWEPSFPAPVTVASGGHNAFPGLAVLADGTLYAMWRVGTHHAGDDGVIKSATSTDNGATWSAATTVLSESAVDYRDPAVALLSDGRIACQFFKYASGVPMGVFVSYSADDGATWATPTAIPFGFTGWAACSGPIAEPAAGTLVAVCYGKDTGQTYTSIRAMTSTDNGATWGSDTLVMDGMTDVRNYEEPFAGVLSDSRVMAHVRCPDNIRRRIIRESDGSWGRPSVVFTGLRARPSWLEFDSGRILMGDREEPLNGSGSVLMLAETFADSPTSFVPHGATGESLGAYQQFVALPNGRVGLLFASEFSNQSATLYFTTVTRARRPSIPTYADEAAADSPAAAWDFDDTSGTTLAGTHPGTLTGSPTLAAPGIVLDGGNSIDFDGVNDMFSIPHAAALNASGAFTLEVWIDPDNPTADRYWPIASKSGFSSTPGQWSIGYDNRTSQGSPQRVRVNAGSGLVNGQLDWLGAAGDMALGGMLAFTVSGAGSSQTIRIYWNAILVASRANATVTWTAGNTSPITNNVASLYYDGRTDALRIYHTALTQERIRAHYLAGITP